jgi:hypothetical protein
MQQLVRSLVIYFLRKTQSHSLLSLTKWQFYFFFNFLILTFDGKMEV